MQRKVGRTLCQWETNETMSRILISVLRTVILSSLLNFHPGDAASVSTMISIVIILGGPLGDYPRVLNEQDDIINSEK